MSKSPESDESATSQAAGPCKQAEGAKQQRGELHRIILQTAMDGFWMTDTQGRLLEVNAAYCRMSGYSSQELLAMRISDLEVAETSDDIANHIGKIMAIGEHRFETRHRRKDGSIIDLEVSAQYRSVQGGRMVAFFRDITERLKAADALSESEKHLRDVLDGLGPEMFVGLMDLQGTVLLANRPAMEAAGLSPKDVFGKPVADTYWFTWSEAVRRRMRAAVARAAQGEPVRYDEQIRVAEGRLIWLDFIIQPLRDETGRIRFLIPSALVITERKQAEAELRESEQRLREVIDHTRAGYFFINRAGLFQHVNSAWLQMHGYESAAEVIGRHFSLTQVESDLEACQRSVEMLLSGGTIPSGEFSRRCRDGSIGYHTFSARPVVQAGDVVGLEGFIIDITERKRAQEALGESEQLLRHLTDNLPNSVVFQAAAEPDGGRRFTFISNAVERLCEVTVEQVFADPDVLYRQVLPEHLALLRQTREQALKGLAPFRIETQCRLPSGRLRWFESSATPRHQADGLLVWDGVQVDITERKRSEEALRQSEERFRKVFEEGGLGMAMADLIGGPFIRANRAFCEMLGYTEEELQRLTFVDVTHPDHRGRDMEAVKKLQAGQIQKHHVEKRYLKKNGEVVWGARTLTTVQDEEGKALHTLAMIEDITERKQAEESLRKKDAMLANITSQVPGMLYQFMQKPDGTYSVPYSSEGVKEIFGCSPEAVRNNFDPIFNVIYPEDQEKIIQTIDASAKSLSQWMCEYRVQLPGQPIKWIFGNSIPEKMADGAVVWSGYNMDITQRKRAEQEKAELETHLHQAQKMESVGRLAGGVAHDFNNMLSVILGYAELALGKVNPSESLHADLEEIITAAERSAKITRQLLAFARKQTVAPKVLDLNATVAGMLKMLERLIGEDIHLDWHPHPDLWPVKVDPSQIDQILANLCVNARDAIPGVGRIIIETGNSAFDAEYCIAHTGFAPGEYARLAVSDDGSGMDEETLAHVFEPFFTTKGIGEGTGLGLAMVYGAVKQNNGFINAYSEPGEGTTFTIYLPRHADETRQALDESAPEPVEGGQETVLIVEDEPAVLELTGKMLARQGYTVLVAGTVGEATRLARAHDAKIHLLITDVIMPGMNGRELWRQLSALRPDMKCLFMSGYTASVIANRGVLQEDAHFIQKPFARKELAAKVREALNRK